MASIANIIDDSERLAPGLAAHGDLTKVLGVLTLQLEKLAGAELEPLTDAELGIQPPAEPDPSTVNEQSARITELEKERQSLQDQLTQQQAGS